MTSSELGNARARPLFPLQDNTGEPYANKQPKHRASSSYTGWVIGAVIAIAAVVGIVMYSGSDTNVASNSTTPRATSPATTGSATTGTGTATDTNSPRTPLPAGPRR